MVIARRRRRSAGSRVGLGSACSIAALIALGFGSASAATNVERYPYVSPVPGSRLVSPWNNVAIRDGRDIDPASLTGAPLAVVGATSGDHPGTLALSGDGKTLVFTPSSPFALGESVLVTLAPEVRTTLGEPLPALEFEFETAGTDPRGQLGAWPEEFPDDLSEGGGPISAEPTPPVVDAYSCRALPVGYPAVSVIRSYNPEPGCVFLTPFASTSAGHLMIVDNLGMPIFYRRTFTPAHDLALQPDGRLTYFDRNPPGGGVPKYFAMDGAYAVVDSFATGNGYLTDSHELRLLPNGHALLMSYDPQPVRMDLVVPGGDSHAVVVGLVIQEIDAGKNVVFQWRSWDHFAISDLVSPTQSLQSGLIDYVHGNAIEVDHDGNLLISSRHLNEITKIDRSTGAILWRWGMNARHNDFTFVNDTRGFSHQHDIRRLPNGHLTLFDNGNYLASQFSRALEYELDETAKVATLVWSYGTNPASYSPFLGSVQRRSSGGTLIAFGGSSRNPKIVDLNANGIETLALGIGSSIWTYRARRFPWRTTLFTTDVESIDFGYVSLQGVATRPLTVRNPSSEALEIACIPTTNPVFEVLNPTPIVVPAGGEVTLNVTFRPAFEGPFFGKLYLRKMTETDVIAQDVVLSGWGGSNHPPDCSGTRASVDTLWPPQHQLVPVTIEGMTDPDGDPITIAITGVTQDEPVNGPGDGATCPDAEVDGAVVRLRAERSGQGNGRVIHVTFQASDGRGGVSSGTVSVCVPLESNAGHEGVTCLDDGLTLNSLDACPASGRYGHIVPESGTVLVPALTPLRTGGATAVVSYALPRDGEVTLAVFDLSGRRVMTLDRGSRRAGEHQVEWSTSGISPGVYFYSLRAAGISLTRPVPVLR